MNIWEIENKFYYHSDPTRIIKIVYHYEIYKMITQLSGDIIECGVFKGNSLNRFLSFRKYLETQSKRFIYGLDVFGSFPPQKIKQDNLFAKKHDTVAGNGYKKKDLEINFKKKGFKNFKLIKGDINKTIPKLLKNKNKIEISLLHLDLDVYQPTLFALNNFKDRIVKNGIILVDDYNIVDGATKAVDEFLIENKKLTLKKLNLLPNPSYIIYK
mgnify:FL=1